MNTNTPMTRHCFRMRLAALAVATCLASGSALANPNGATVTNGSATITSTGSTLTITNTPNTIINWHDFSIGSGETTQFIQQSATSAVLNRVTGGDASLILGTLQSNGQVFLINPAGIVFGVGSMVNVAGLVASTLNITDDDFLAGKHIYNANIANPGNVTNAGDIRTPNGGFVYLIGTRVENSGIINTPSGEAILAAGHSVEIVDSTDLSQRVLVSAQSQDVNLSQMMVENDGNIFAVLNSGRVSANTVTQDATGKIYFTSAGTVQTTSSSVTEASGSSTLDGGYIRGFADTAGLYAGTFDVSGKNGGFVETSGYYLDVNGIQLRANALNSSSTGGTWLLDPYDITIINSSGVTNGTDNGDGTFSLTGTSTIGNDNITSALESGTNVIIDTAGAGSDAGNITVAADISIDGTSDVSLTLLANNDITINSGVTIEASVVQLDVTLNADSDGNGGGAITLDFNTGGGASIKSNGGDIVLGGGTNPLIGLSEGVFMENSTLNAGGGDITINGSGVQMLQGNINGGNVTINAGSGTFQLVGDGSGDTEINANQNLSIRGGAVQITTGSQLFANNNVSITSGSISLDDSEITAANNLAISNTGALSLVNSTMEAQGTSASIQTGSVFMDDDTLIEVSGDMTLSSSGSYTAINNSNISVTGLLQMNVGSMNVADSSISASGNFGLSTGSLTLTDTSLTSGGTFTMTSGGATAMTDSTIDANGNLNMTVGSLTMTRSTVGDASGMTPTNINIVSGGNVVLNDGSDIVADQEISMQIAGQLSLNTVGSNASHISTFSDNTIFLYFPTLFSGGFLLDGVGGVLISPFNPSTGFFTGTNLTNLAILNSNLFITYAPAGPITGIVSQTNTNTVATNPYLDPYGPRQTGPGDSSYPSDVNWSPFPIRDPFSEVRECS